MQNMTMLLGMPQFPQEPYPNNRSRGPTVQSARVGNKNVKSAGDGGSRRIITVLRTRLPRVSAHGRPLLPPVWYMNVSVVNILQGSNVLPEFDMYFTEIGRRITVVVAQSRAAATYAALLPFVGVFLL